MGRRLHGDDAGSGAIEYIGGILVAALVIGGAYAGAAGSRVQSAATHAICSIVDLGHCTEPVTAAGTTSGSNGTIDGSTDDRRDAERQTRDNRRTRNGGTTQPDQPGTPGGEKPASPLGLPVPGTSVPKPDPPTWTPVDGGAGKHGSEGAGIKDRATQFAVEAAANAVSGSWPDASRNLLHYLGNSGDPLKQDVDKIMKDVPEFAQTVTDDRGLLGQEAVAQAKDRGATTPITFPINTPWTGYGYNPPYANKNWFYALGAWQYNQTGQVTVYPPSAPGQPWTYKVTTSVNLRDQYNWDHGKSTGIGPFTITDDQMAGLHRKGLAQEYTNYGESSTSTTEGTVP